MKSEVANVVSDEPSNSDFYKSIDVCFEIIG